MNDLDLAKLVRDVGTFQAEYQPVPIADTPVGCVLPPLIPGIIDLPTPDLPDIPKICTPPFIPFPVIPEPFVPPETCPRGITVSPIVVDIYASISATTPSGTITIGAGQDPVDICNYIVDVPPFIVPCYPSGPQLSGSASITILDSKGDVLGAGDISITQDVDTACKWTLGGDTTIVIPEVPCPTGLTVTVNTFDSNGNPLTNQPTESTDSTGCNIQIDVPFPTTFCPSGQTLTWASVDPVLWLSMISPTSGTVAGVILSNRGDGYSVDPPIVTFHNETTGGGAEAAAVARTGLNVHTGRWEVTDIVMTNKGHGYMSAPLVTIDGGGYSVRALGTAYLNNGAQIADTCDFTVPIPAPICPTGSHVTVSSVPISTWAIPAAQTGCDFNIPIPTPICVDGFKFVDATTVHINKTANPTPLAKSLKIYANWNTYTVEYPSQIVLNANGSPASGQIVVTDISAQLVGGASHPHYKPGDSTYDLSGDTTYNWLLSANAGFTGVVVSNSGPGPRGPWTDQTLNFTVTGAGTVTFELILRVDNPWFAIPSQDYYYWFTIPVKIPDPPTPQPVSQGFHLMNLRDYKSMLGATGPTDNTNECGAALVGDIDLNIPCPNGYTASSPSNTLTFGVTGSKTSTALSVNACSIGFTTPEIPALLCPGGYINSTVNVSIGYTGDTGYPGSFSGGVGNAAGNGGGEYCGFAITGQILLPTGPTNGSSGGGNMNFMGDYKPGAKGTPCNGGEPYKNGDIVRISPSSAASLQTVAGVYICEVNGGTGAYPDPGSSCTAQEVPRNPVLPSLGQGRSDGETIHWRWLSTWPTMAVMCSTAGVEVSAIADEQPLPS